MGALLAPNMAGWGADGVAMADEGGPKLKERAFIPDAWDDSDDDGGDDDGEETTTETESTTIKGSTNSLAGLADSAWNSDEDDDA